MLCLCSHVLLRLRPPPPPPALQVVTPADFDAYMRYHARRLFRPEFEPRPLVFAVRRSADHSPEGTFRIDDQQVPDANAPPEPIFTVSVHSPASPRRRMDFPLSAATRVPFGGTVHLHTWLSHRFSSTRNGVPYRGCVPSEAPRELKLVATARQFSSFIIMVGRIGSPTSFEPMSAIIVKDKDEVRYVFTSTCR